MALPISTGSGATLASNLINGEHLQIISPVSLYPLPAGTNSIGYVSLPSINGTVAISNTPAVSQSGTWNFGVTGLVSLPSGTEVRSLATILNFPATQAVTQSGTWNVGVTGLVSLPSGTEVRSLATLLNQPPLVASSAYIGLASVNIGGTLPALSVGSNFIGLASVQGNVNATQTGTWNVGVTGLISLASGTEIRSLATILNFPAIQNVAVTNLISLASGTFVSLNPGTNHIGSVSIFGTISSTPGMTTLFPGPNFIGLVTTVQGNSIPAGTNHIGSVSIFGNVSTTPGMTTLFPGPNFIGLVTTVPGAATPAGANFIGLASVQGNVNATQAGTWTVQPGNTANSTPWLVTQSGGLISLASGTELRSLATLLNQPPLVASSAYIGLASVNIGGTLPPLPTGTAFVGLATVVLGNQPALIASSAYIGLASVNIGGTLPALSAGTNLIGQVLASNETSTIYNSTTALTPKFAVISASSSGANTIVAAVTSKKIRVLAYTLIANAAVNAKFQSAVTPTDKTGLLYLAANTGASPAYSPVGHFETIAGEALSLNLSAAIAVGGHLTYIEI
jgi:hypothetical protein